MDDWWIGEAHGVNCQERTKEELLETLRITLKEALEFNRQDAMSAALRQKITSRKKKLFYEAERINPASSFKRLRVSEGG